jgi:CheY-like chemotaxis protein
MMGRRSILLVEDDAGVGHAMADLLSVQGYEVLCARDGAEALEILAEREPPPGLILLDLMMPGMDPAEFRRRQLSSPRVAGIPLVVVSADRQAEQRARELKAAGCLVKPMAPERLLEVVRRYC